jgi:hypothetical protein
MEALSVDAIPTGQGVAQKSGRAMTRYFPEVVVVAIAALKSK